MQPIVMGSIIQLESMVIERGRMDMVREMAVEK
jgi:hypothetical protein